MREDGRNLALLLVDDVGQAQERAHVLVDDVGGAAHGLGRQDAAVRLHLEHQLVVVRALPDAGVRDVERAAAHRREQRVHMDDADGVLRALVALGRHVAATHADADRHVQLAAVGNRCDDMLRIHQRELGRDVEIGARDRARALCRHMRRGFLDVVVERGEHEPLDVEDDVGDVLDDALGRGELVLDALDLDGGRFRAVQRGEQHAAHAVAQRIAVAALKRFHDETRYGFVDFFRCYRRPHELCHVV